MQCIGGRGTARLADTWPRSVGGKVYSVVLDAVSAGESRGWDSEQAAMTRGGEVESYGPGVAPRSAPG